MTCATLETIAAWVQGDLSEADSEAFEEHLFACDRCTAQTHRMQRLVEQLSMALPSVLTRERREALAARHPGLPTVDIEPGQQRMLRLGGTQPVGVWIIHAPLAGATRVDLEVRGGDALLLSLADVPFDAERGEVVLACHTHYSALPRLIQVRLKAAGADGERPVNEYILDHDFESS